MAVFVFVEDADIYDRLLLEHSGQWEAFNQFVGRPLKPTWVPVPVKISKGSKAGDFPLLASHVPIFSERALNTLQPLIGNSIEALPLMCRSGTFHAINVLEVVDCLDEARSEIIRFPSGGIMSIDRYVFRAGSVTGKHIFKVQGAELKDVLISEEFRHLVKVNGLAGLKLQEVGS